MNNKDFYKKVFAELNNRRETLTEKQRETVLRKLIFTAAIYARPLSEIRETSSAANRRKLKSKETSLDPKPAMKPVNIAKPHKPKKPKYSGI